MSVTCDCLHKESNGEFLHADRCLLVAEKMVPEGTEVDSSDIRVLAEMAAHQDIDTALYVYRGYLKGAY